MAKKKRRNAKIDIPLQQAIIDLYEKHVKGKIDGLMDPKVYKADSIADIVGCGYTSVTLVIKAYFMLGDRNPKALDAKYHQIRRSKNSKKKIIDRQVKVNERVSKFKTCLKELKEYDKPSQQLTSGDIWKKMKWSDDPNYHGKYDPKEYLLTIIPSDEWNEIILLIERLIEDRHRLRPTGVHDFLVHSLHSILLPYMMFNAENGRWEGFYNFTTDKFDIVDKNKQNHIKPNKLYRGLFEEEDYEGWQPEAREEDCPPEGTEIETKEQFLDQPTIEDDRY